MYSRDNRDLRWVLGTSSNARTAITRMSSEMKCYRTVSTYRISKCYRAFTGTWMNEQNALTIRVCRDAAWELEPDSFNELTERYNSCDATVCHCDGGRKFTRSRGWVTVGDYYSSNMLAFSILWLTHFCRNWRIILCQSCGSEVVHVYCGRHLLNKRKEWNCETCALGNYRPRSCRGENE